jgi:hypothetical protein
MGSMSARGYLCPLDPTQETAFLRYDFVPPLTGLPWEPSGQIDLGDCDKFVQVNTDSDYPGVPPNSGPEPPTNPVNVASADPIEEMMTPKIWFESTRDAFTAFCGEACFPVLYDYGSSITLHPRSFREMLVRKGFQAQQVGAKRMSASGFAGAPVIGSVPIYELSLRLWDNSVPVRVLSCEFPDHQTNIKTLLLRKG